MIDITEERIKSNIFIENNIQKLSIEEFYIYFKDFSVYTDLVNVFIHNLNEYITYKSTSEQREYNLYPLKFTDVLIPHTINQEILKKGTKFSNVVYLKDDFSRSAFLERLYDLSREYSLEDLIAFKLTIFVGTFNIK